MNVVTPAAFPMNTERFAAEIGNSASASTSTGTIQVSFSDGSYGNGLFPALLLGTPYCDISCPGSGYSFGKGNTFSALNDGGTPTADSTERTSAADAPGYGASARATGEPRDGRGKVSLLSARTKSPRDGMETGAP